MSCEQFKDALEEYLDESLDPASQAEARAHGKSCALCGEMLRRRQAVARNLRLSLREQTQGMALSQATRRRIAEACEPRGAAVRWGEKLRSWLKSPAWAMAVILILGLVVISGRFFRRTEKSANLSAKADPATWVIDVPFQTETHISRVENGQAVDAVVIGTENLDASFSPEPTPAGKPRSELRLIVKTQTI